jgi:cellulose synthase/poly-beta-1,6-N-acetylglucosamine synthase-like glycosyltransferase
VHDLEIPLKSERGWRYRAGEILPGLTSWTVVFLPLILSFLNPTWAAYFIILFMLAWLVKAFGYAYRTTLGYNRLTQFMRLDWRAMLKDLSQPKEALAYSKSTPSRHLPDWHYKNLTAYASLDDSKLHPHQVYHAVILPTYNEPPEVIEPTIETLLDSKFDVKNKVIFILAYEQRAGRLKAEQSKEQIKKYGDGFLKALAVEHPADLPGEVIGKGGNATFAGRKLQRLIKQMGINPEQVVVTTLDSDNRPHQHYFSALSYIFTLDPDRRYKSYQPIPMFLNNIWDAPAPMRVLATGNSFWNLISSTRPHLMRNFSSHAQSLKALIDTDFWSVRTIVEDGHQFWRTYFRYNGRHSVEPIFIPVYQDAVLEENYRRTLKAQFIQLRRWAYGASDVAYLLNQGYFKPNKVPKRDLFFKWMRLMEAHVSWAAAPLILAGAAWLPIIIYPDAQDSFIAHQLPRLASNINTLIAGGILITVFLSMRVLPPRPPRYKAHRNIFMVLQWVLLPISSIVYGSFAALYSQTRLMIGKYLDKFDVTTKAIKK